MDQGDGVAVGGGDRDGAARAGNAAGKADGSRRRGAHRCAASGPDVNATMLAARVRVVAERECSKHRPVCGPGPGERGRNADLERDEDRQQRDESFHPPLLSSLSIL